jgi:hypothetical protein
MLCDAIRYGAAFYQVHSINAEGKSTGVVMAGTLSVSDEMADRYTHIRAI